MNATSIGAARTVTQAFSTQAQDAEDEQSEATNSDANGDGGRVEGKRR